MGPKHAEILNWKGSSTSILVIIKLWEMLNNKSYGEWIRLKKSDGSKRHSLQAVELSQWFQAAVQIVSNLPAPSNGGPIYRFLGMPAMRTRWMAGAAAHKSG